MPRYHETIAMAEQAMRHVLSEQEKLLKMKDAADIIGLLLPINELACETSRLLTENRFPASIRKLTKKAKMIEEQADELSIALWRPILISLSAIYERIEESLKRKSGEHGLRADTRAQYHNLRIRLLEQLIGARMLVNNSDLGDENERIWQEFFERQLGPMFRVLRGGHISDYAGNISGQLDLIIVPSNAQVSIPGGSNHGKAQVFVDQVISVIMIKSNLTTSELDKDWKALQSIPCYKEMEKDYPGLRGHPWPFCYIVSAQGDIANLEDSIPTTYTLPEQDEQETRPPFDTSHYRWFRYGSEVIAGQLVAVEEWLNCKSKDNHHRRVAVFDARTGAEITHERLGSLRDPSELAELEPEIRSGLLPDGE
jgi:hypothetical protein